MTPADTPRLADYLDHILQSIANIREYVAGMDETTFAKDRRTQDAVIRNLEIIGEASRNIERRYPEFAASHPAVPWAVAYEMRNVLAHGYFKVDIGVIWTTIESDLPLMEKAVGRIR